MKFHLRPIALLLLIIVAGCAKVKDRSVLLRGVETRQVRLELKHTKISDLSIRVPVGFMSEWTEEAHYDKFFIYMPQDTGDVQKGMITLDITPNPPKLIPDTAKYARSIGRIGEHEVPWREMTVVDDDGAKLYQREMVTKDIFTGLENYGSTSGIVLHAFVVGSDSLLVERLTAVVETLALPPLKPNL
jgi:hypothetical protein